MAARDTDADGLASIAAWTEKLLELVAPFVRYEHPQGRLALSVFATRPRVPQESSPVWSATGGTARVELEAPAHGEPSTLLLSPGRLVVEDAFVTLRTRFREEGPPGAAAHASELLDGIFGFVKRSREPDPETRLDDGVLIWERPVNRCEVLLVIQRAFGRPLGGEIRFRFADDRIVLEMADQDDPRWETTGGLGIFDPWPFAVWLARRHVKLLRPALRIAIEPERSPRASPKKPAPRTSRSARTKKGASNPKSAARKPASARKE